MLDSGLLQREHISVSLNHYRTLLLRDRRTRPVEAVKEIALAEELTLRRVHVFRAQRIVVAELARLETKHAAASIGERKQQPSGEIVVAAPVHEAGRDELFASEAAAERFTHERRAAERESESVLAAHFFAEPAPREVVASKRACLRVPEIALVERGGCVEEFEQAFAVAATGVLLRRRLLVLDLDVEAVGKPLDRAGEVKLLRVAHERDQVPLRAAAEAVVELVRRVDREARRPFLVERATAEIARPGLAQLRSRGDDRDHVGCNLDFLDG